MKDVTSTSFGLVIAYLLPGLAALYSLSFWSCSVAGLFSSFETAQSSIGFFLLVVLGALTTGLLVDVPRRLFYEYVLCKNDRLGAERFAELGAEGKLAAFRAAIDEHYRYHQFWGGMTIILPLLFSGWLKDSWARLNYGSVSFFVIVFLVLELMVGYAAMIQYRALMSRANHILASKAKLISKGE